MDWQRLTATMVRCECGEPFFYSPAGTVTWWARRFHGQRIPGANEYRCDRKGCRKEYLGASMPAAHAQHPPRAA